MFCVNRHLGANELRFPKRNSEFLMDITSLLNCLFSLYVIFTGDGNYTVGIPLLSTGIETRVTNAV